MISCGPTDRPRATLSPSPRVAAIQAAKNTSQIIPYCHPLPLDFVDCQFEVGEGTILIRTEVKAIYKTGVEMEALTAASVAALTLYDMLKIVDETMEIRSIKLVSKTGGKSDFVSPFPESRARRRPRHVGLGVRGKEDRTARARRFSNASVTWASRQPSIGSSRMNRN